MKTKMKRNIEDASLDYWPCSSVRQSIRLCIHMSFGSPSTHNFFNAWCILHPITVRLTFLPFYISVRLPTKDFNQKACLPACLRKIQINKASAHLTQSHLLVELECEIEKNEMERWKGVSKFQNSRDNEEKMSQKHQLSLSWGKKGPHAKLKRTSRMKSQVSSDFFPFPP